MSWKKYKDLGPWEFEKSGADNRYNEGNLIATAANPIWDLEANRGTPITKGHNPCGYWTKEYVLPEPTVYYKYYGTGENSNAELGIGDRSDRSIYTIQASSFIWKDYSGGRHVNWLIKNDGSLYAFGNNYNYATGVPGGIASEQYSTPQLVSSEEWTFVGCGGDASFGIKADGTLWCVGSNDKGQLGLGDHTQRTILTQIGSANDWAFVASKDKKTFAIKTNGIMYACGYNGTGVLGLGYDGADVTTLTQVAGGDLFVSIDCGTSHSVAITTTGKLMMVGFNLDGCMGLGPTMIQKTVFSSDSSYAGDWISVSASKEYYTLCIKADGSLWVCGRNQFGQLGLGDTTYRYILTQVPGSFLEAQAGWNYNTLVIKEGNTLWGAGLNTPGALGIGNTTSTITTFTQEILGYTNWGKVQVGSYHSSAFRIN